MSAVEQFDSRFGNSGIGNWNRTRRFHVTVDSSIPVEHQDPLADSALPPRGSGFATFPGVVVTGYTPVERLSLRSWIVDVNYGVPTTLTPTWGGQWQVSISSSLESEHQDVATRDAQQIEEGIVPEVVGPWYYAEVKEADAGSREDGTIYTVNSRIFNSVTGKIEPYVKKLRRLPLRKLEGMQVTPPVATITLQRRFARTINYTRAKQKVYGEFGCFLWAQPGQLKFMTLNVNPTLVHIIENPTGVGEVVSLSFQWRTEGHQYTIVHKYEDPDDPKIVSLILKEGKPVIEIFSRYLETSFTSMLNEL